MKKLLVSLFLFSCSLSYAQEVDVEVIVEHKSSFYLKDDKAKVFNLLKLENGNYILVKDDAKSAEDINENYFELWQTKNQILDGQNFFFLSSKLKKTAALDYAFDVKSNNQIRYKLKASTDKYLLKVDDFKMDLDPIIYQCDRPENEEHEKHSGTETQELRIKHKCTRFKIIY